MVVIVVVVAGLSVKTTIPAMVTITLTPEVPGSDWQPPSQYQYVKKQ
jgi:hypothetical protein